MSVRRREIGGELESSCETDERQEWMMEQQLLDLADRAEGQLFVGDQVQVTVAPGLGGEPLLEGRNRHRTLRYLRQREQPFITDKKPVARDL